MNYNNEIEDFNEEYQSYDEPVFDLPKESWLQKNKFGLGMLSGALSVILVGALILNIFKMTGQILVIGESGVTPIKNTSILDEKTADKINEIYSYMNLYYYEDFEVEDIQEFLCKGVMEGLDDPYSVYYTPEEYEDLQVSTSGTYYGIGAGLTQDVKTMQVTISKVYRGTPSEEAGLMNGDIILKVEDIDATSMELSDLVQRIRGEEGTTVHMSIYRESTGEMLEFDVERRQVVLPSIEGEMLENAIGYIQVTEFQSETDEQFEAMVENLKGQGAKGLIIDVRANPGGMLSSVVNMLDYILPEGMLVYTEDKYGNRDEYKSDARCIDLPIVLLIDESSASASEILAGAIKDYEYGTLVGKTTYGKGIVQNIIPLSDGDAIKMTTSKYFTPNGNYIHKVGITPDIEVTYEYSGPKDEVYNKQYDNQFLIAVEVMTEMLKGE